MRETTDVAVLDLIVDLALSNAASTVAGEFGLSDKCLNDGPSDLLTSRSELARFCSERNLAGDYGGLHK